MALREAALERRADFATLWSMASLHAELEAGRKIVIAGPSCAYTIKKEYPHLLGTPEAELTHQYALVCDL